MNDIGKTRHETFLISSSVFKKLHWNHSLSDIEMKSVIVYPSYINMQCWLVIISVVQQLKDFQWCLIYQWC